MSTGKYQLSPVDNDLDLDLIDATLPWLSRFACKMCKRTFPTKAKVIEHKKLQHKRFLCEYCGKLCSSNNDLKKHTVTHTIIKTHPWQCQNCGKRFEFVQDFESHLKTFQYF